MSFDPPPLSPIQPPWPQFQVWWQQVLSSLKATLADISGLVASLAQAVADIQAILDDNTLTPDKKAVWIFMYSFLTGEQAGLDAEATTFGITTQKTTYDTAITALTTYLGTLTTPVAWNDVSANTTIVGTTFRSKFNDVLVAKQALLNKMHDTSKSLANTAQTTANTASTNASTAQSTANTVKRDDAITASYTAPGTILSASDAGADATISVAAHTRVYGDISNVSVNSGSLTGLSYSTLYYVYYDQTSRAGGAVTYHADTNANHALPNKAAGRHFVGSVITPASGAGDTSGGSAPPAGGGDVDKGDVGSTL